MPAALSDNIRELSRRLRAGMLRGLTLESLGYALEAFERGNLAPAVQMWEAMTTRDDVLSNVKPKREKALARRKWDMVCEDDSAEAKAHAATLRKFWDNIEAVNAYDANETGGIARLVRQMLSAVSFKYSVHHLNWSVNNGALHCRFEHVPLWFFENTSGALRFLPNGRGLKGVPLHPGEWLTVCGDGLMIAASIGYTCKRNSFADWCAFSEKFSIPGILGRTPHPQDSDAGRAMADAVEAFTSDWSATLYGDEGGGKIEVIETGSGASLPCPALVERIDRRFAALYRGADLSSISSTSGQGTGASLQEGESLILELDDAAMIQEKLWQIERQVIEWHYGPGVEPLAWFEFVIPQPEDSKATLEAIKALVDLGAPVAVEHALQRFGFPMPDAGDALLEPRDDYTSSYSKQAASPPAAPGAQSEINAAADGDEFLKSCAATLKLAAAKDRQPIAAAVRKLINTPDGTLAEAMRQFIADLPAHVAQDKKQVAAWNRILSTAWLRAQDAAALENSDA